MKKTLNAIRGYLLVIGFVLLVGGAETWADIITGILL